MPIEADSPESIATRTAHGQRAMLLSHFVRVTCKVASVLVLARLVGPGEHGLYAMAASLTLLLTYFRDFGLGTAAIQARELSEDQRTTLWWLHVILGGTLAVATLALIPGAVWFYGEPGLAPLLAAMSVSFVFMGISAWPRVLLVRELRFAAINRAETSATVVATGAMIGAGALGAGAYAFVVFLLTVELLTAVLAWRACGWRPHGAYAWRHLRPLLGPGMDLTGYALLVHLSQQLDTLLIGRWFGPRSLGLYVRAGQLLQLPGAHIATPLTQVLQAALARLGPAAPEFRTQVRATTTLVLHLALPLSAACIALPTDVTLTLLGRAWVEAAEFLRWMGVSAALAALLAVGHALNVATGHTRRLAGLALLALGANLAALWLARSLGPPEIALALASVNTLLLGPRLWWICRATPLRPRDFGAASAGPMAVAAALGAGMAATAAGSGLAAGPGRLTLALVGGAVAATALCAAWARPRHELKEVWARRPRRDRPSLQRTGSQ